jgi:hypothetical protein
MKEMHISKKQLIFTAYNVPQAVEDFSIQAESYVFAGKMWAAIYTTHIPSGKQSSKAIVAYKNADIEETVAQLVYEALPRDDVAFMARLDAYFSEEIPLPPEE